jgi:hypothetical protein
MRSRSPGALPYGLPVLAVSLSIMVRAGAQQDDQAETGTEADLVLLAPGDEQDVTVLGVQEPGDRLFPPPLPAVWQLLAPAVVGVDGLVSEGRQLADHARLPGARHPGQQNPLRGREPTIPPLPAAARRAWPDLRCPASRKAVPPRSP